MQLSQRIDLLVHLGEYMQNGNNEFELVKENAYRENPWFIPEFIDLAVANIANDFLQEDKLKAWVDYYNIPAENKSPKTVGIVMAGNIPLVGFHDLLSVFISGHTAVIKPSSKDVILIKHLINKMNEWEGSIHQLISLAETLKDCDAYIATGSNNSGRYFEYYFGKYPSIIRKNKTSVAILDGSESPEELELLTDDMQLYFGLGCRNITKLYIPRNYDFVPLLSTIKKYDRFMEFYKYKHNYDYQLALLIMNNKFYMTDGSLLLTENDSLFAPVSQVNYSFFEDAMVLKRSLSKIADIQCITGHGFIPFGRAQFPSLTDYADGKDTLLFLSKL
ncbi:acyl-CoA reductase [Panacibacter ginsenosidivorans]|uniref:Acyl-CoA reductase n=1 Tax=Panacibacter ginsenosidivorans TaxID=1813871 RepID=A0A5B8VER3_9BACT|nr:acyl-CoA reductase [Panacibacter ginsenosidivorans]QEC69789.1 acyl-CoA reductase [Panacibacter ginsenosidivorans]